jgi:OOP family OmpA-OmpF porin
MYKNRSYLFGVAVAAFFSLLMSVAIAQDIRSTLFKGTDALMQQAKDARAELLSPKNYAAAQSAYAKAEKEVNNGRADRAEKELAKVDEALNKALAASELAVVTFDTSLKARELAVTADAEKYEPDLWASAEKQFADAATRLEAGNVKNARKSADKATQAYDDAELAAIKTAVLGNARNLIAEADKNGVEKYAGKTLGRANDLVAQATADLDGDRYTTAGPQMLAAEAEYEARHAAYLSGQLKELSGKKISGEDLILAWEKPLRDVAGALGVSTDMTEGYAQPGAAALSQANSLIAQNSEMAARITEMEVALGSSELVVQETERLQKELTEIEALFQPNEARVFREGNDLIMRLVGLSFPVGQAVIQTEYYGILQEVQRALAVYPNSMVVIEGHTDSQGSDATNMRLSQERADAVRMYLVANQGLAASRATAVGYGEDRPIASDSTAEGRAQNRRIDVVIKAARARGN